MNTTTEQDTFAMWYTVDHQGRPYSSGKTREEAISNHKWLAERGIKPPAPEIAGVYKEVIYTTRTTMTGNIEPVGE